MESVTLCRLHYIVYTLVLRVIKTHATLDDQEVQEDRNQRLKKTMMTKSASNLFLFMVDLFSPNSPSVFHSVSASLANTWLPSNLCF